VWRALLDEGVLIRQPEPAGWLRVSIGTPNENDMFRLALLAATEQDTTPKKGTP
jgi:histidinol-phosphate aminotransferase